ncbi:pyridoxine-5'-phosphate oxidase isoform X2 [Hydra vulgaris]
MSQIDPEKDDECWILLVSFMIVAMQLFLQSLNEISDMRIDYNLSRLPDDMLPAKDPYLLFQLWFQEAANNPGIKEANAMNLATASKDGVPSARWVLLKGYSNKGFRFFTNYDSQKGKELNENPNAALTFYWEPLQKQIRITGRVEKISKEESTEYFHSRPFASQIGALVSCNQSSAIPSEQYLEERRKKLTEEFSGKVVPKPDNWGGYLLTPKDFEFWCGGSGRIHDRIKFVQSSNYEHQQTGENGWSYVRLSP